MATEQKQGVTLDDIASKLDMLISQLAKKDEGKEENVVFPTNKEMREKLETAIMDEYNRKLEEAKKINEE